MNHRQTLFGKNKYITHTQKGFNLIEIILALAVITLVFTAVFNFAATVYVRSQQVELPQNYFSYNYSEPLCVLKGNIDDVQLSAQNISMAPYISTSTRVTSIHGLGNNMFIVTTDSASTTESDIFLFNISINNSSSANLSLISSIDVGPGIQDGKLVGDFLYVANTSVNSHVKSFRVDASATGTDVFTELSNIRIPSLAAGFSNPKKLSIYNRHLMLGSEKSNTGPEVFMMLIESDGSVRYVATTTELNGQLNQAMSAHEHVYIANAADPELRALDRLWREFFSYDAPLTLGNGKSILFLNPYMILGRTLGSSELSLLQANSTTTMVLATVRTNGTVDYIQELKSKHDTRSRFVAITANEQKELQFWHIDTEQLTLDKNIDILGRVTAYTCDKDHMYLFVTSNNQTTLTWLNL